MLDVNERIDWGRALYGTTVTSLFSPYSAVRSCISSIAKFFFLSLFIFDSILNFYISPSCSLMWKLSQNVLNDEREILTFQRNFKYFYLFARLLMTCTPSEILPYMNVPFLRRNIFSIHWFFFFWHSLTALFHTVF